MSEKEAHRSLVDGLVDLTDEKNKAGPAILAALRSGLGKRPGQAPRMFPFLFRFINSSNVDAPYVKAAFIVSALFAKHPHDEKGVSLGAALRLSVKTDDNPKGKHGLAGVESRLVAALDAHSEDIQRHLEGLIGLLESAGVSLDYSSLQRDLAALLSDDDSHRDRTRTRLARDFWAGPRRDTGEPTPIQSP